MKIQALGGCCKKAITNYQNAVEAAKLCKINEEVEHISDMNQIIKLGVMSTPGLIINGKVVAVGRVLSVNQIVELIKASS